jgi:phosphoglucomutase/phosphomannomutase
MMDFKEAKDKRLVRYHGQELDSAYCDTVSGVSLSGERDVKIVYSPMNGTGRTSVYPVLQKCGFDVSLDPKTSNFSGKFEHITFNIPNPEVVESFEASLPFAEESHADILISSDPDADRIGIMVNHKGAFRFLTGNEIGILLTQYAISKYRSKGWLVPESTIIKTSVTTSLIEKIAQDNNIHCIGDLLVGFKYIGDVMNRLEKDNKMDAFILGAEESHGYIMGNYCRDKDAASAAVWISEHAAELKKENKTLVDKLEEIYSRYGYCHNYLTEIRYCYNLIGVEFPDRGFLLFWQLPLNDKLKYFEIEDRIVDLKDIPDEKTRKDELDQLIGFLGASPIEKVDEAFKAKYQAGIREYLDFEEFSPL